MRKPEKQTPEPVSSKHLFSFSNHIEQVKRTLTYCKYQFRIVTNCHLHASL
ncbi:unnamed protein product [Schistosoma mattheei]|uniref:Uncharacterized protein n=1 Tax=Schistosoma mattheei TaxID=31246 RepID=A0A183NJ39_9TREM|nr:unnamed protein product [Schistosoma mattheei]